jgi:tRNA pseudouridine38-40 synthase
MVRYQAILAYDGTRFQGFQRQENARTVQNVVERALHALGWNGKTILAAGRTDTGVHASGQVIAFDMSWPHPTADLLAALNANLPVDVAVRHISSVSGNFHPRYAALARKYHYRLVCDQIRQPLRERYVWRVWPEVSLVLLQSVAGKITGKHDFGAFGAPHRTGGSTVREVTSATWYADGPELVFEIVGNAFLYHMVRRLVFFMVKVGQGRLEPESVLDYLEGENLPRIQGLAPPQGLFLVEVIYPSGE